MANANHAKVLIIFFLYSITLQRTASQTPHRHKSRHLPSLKSFHGIRYTIFALNEIENFSENRKSSQFRVSTELPATSAARAGRTRTARRRPDLFGDFAHSTICRASECRECRLSTVLAAENRRAHHERGGFRFGACSATSDNRRYSASKPSDATTQRPMRKLRTCAIRGYVQQTKK